MDPNTPRSPSGAPILACGGCGQPFVPKHYSAARRRQAKFCSLLCAGAASRARTAARTEKRCTTCRQVKALGEFYREAKRADGRSCVCKACRFVYGQTEAGREAQRRYTSSEHGSEAVRRNTAITRSDPRKYAAHKAVTIAVRQGRLQRQPCEECGSTRRVHAHHDNYSRPLDVRWLCSTHHKRHHARLRAGQPESQ